MTAYLDRLVDALVAEFLRQLPAVLIVGPRAVGKTTTALRFARTVIRLDRDADAAAFRADPDVALHGLQEPVLLDEWQVVPSVLGALKRAVDDDPRPGRFLLTGSVRADIEADTWPGTGRLVRVAMSGLVVREVIGNIGQPGLFERIVAEGVEAAARIPTDTPDLKGYIEMALAGSFPSPALHLQGPARRRWLDGYLDQILTRDAAQVAGDRDPVRLRRYFEALASSTAEVVEDKKLYDAAGINAKTAAAYDRLLTNLFIVEAVPAWTTNRLKRLARSPKRHVVDPGLVSAALRVDVDGVMRDGDLLGRVLDSFVMAQLRAEIAVGAAQLRSYHLRQQQGRHEVDTILEAADGRVIGVEVKAEAAPTRHSARHLRWLRDELGDRFIAGLVLHTGPRPFALDDRLLALPICALWA
jgi:Predicted ATPase (AAA+ superfamily)